MVALQLFGGLHESHEGRPICLQGRYTGRTPAPNRRPQLQAGPAPGALCETAPAGVGPLLQGARTTPKQHRGLGPCGPRRAEALGGCLEIGGCLEARSAGLCPWRLLPQRLRLRPGRSRQARQVLAAHHAGARLEQPPPEAMVVEGVRAGRDPDGIVRLPGREAYCTDGGVDGPLAIAEERRAKRTDGQFAEHGCHVLLRGPAVLLQSWHGNRILRSTLFWQWHRR
mmetsp:Transcript_14264/g.32372  ORF Transcript_14264/g.32372 Transcript_14264/m.32372 type:complete len:226 (+) Transcript_14264:76-753(+)